MGIVVTIITVVAKAVVGLIGFESGGVVAGSLAAGIQSACYTVAIPSGSAFATCQSLAMTTGAAL